ncbi:unnamed protein product [Adineta ricciae]|uniref:Uncharacterized protein n=1 Tax=Adineta ricciae TaxID=249248 RepID=A0A814WJJ7_ADIRI|nr:unnamed protein product [Adineta ricciae]
MSSDIPGFYYDAVQRRYYRITSQSSNAVPSARAISDRARQEELTNKQLDLINSPSKQHSVRYKEKKRLIRSRLSLLRQREYGQQSRDFCHNYLRCNLIETLSTRCFIDPASSFSLENPAEPSINYDMTITNAGQCIRLINYKFYLNLLKNPTHTYQLQTNPIDDRRSSYFLDSFSPFMSATLLHDENHVNIRFLRFSSSQSAHTLPMLSADASAPDYYYEETCQTVQSSSSSFTHTSPLMIRCSGPCCYSKSLNQFAFNINNHVYIYDFQTFQSICSLRVPIRRVTLTDMKFSYENSNILYTTNGHQFQQWDLRQSNYSTSTRIHILCSKIQCLQRQSNCILTSSFDERINLIDLRHPTKPLLTYDLSSTSSNNPHFSFTIDTDTEHFVAACSQHHIVHIWDLNTGRLLNRLRCPIPKNFLNASAKCSITSFDNTPVLGIYHPEYCRLTGLMNR